MDVTSPELAQCQIWRNSSFYEWTKHTVNSQSAQGIQETGWIIITIFFLSVSLDFDLRSAWRSADFSFP